MTFLCLYVTCLYFYTLYKGQPDDGLFAKLKHVARFSIDKIVYDKVVFDSIKFSFHFI
jgi:hypothetical protein